MHEGVTLDLSLFLKILSCGPVFEGFTEEHYNIASVFISCFLGREAGEILASQPDGT